MSSGAVEETKSRNNQEQATFRTSANLTFNFSEHHGNLAAGAATAT
jgi:hypothetical protein